MKVAVAEPAIRGKYETPEPNARIELHEGLLRISWESRSIECKGSIFFDWVPSPRIGFELVVPFDAGFKMTDDLSELQVELADHGGSGRGRVWRKAMSTKADGVIEWTLSGDMIEDFVVGNPAATDSVVFHVPNFPDCVGMQVHTDSEGGMSPERMRAVTQDWAVELDDVSYSNGLRGTLSSRGGYGITHFGRIRRNDGAAVRFEDLEHMLGALCWWLTFLRSERTGPMFILGVHDDETVWEIWRTPIVTPWSNRLSWLPKFIRDGQGRFGPPQVDAILQYLDNLRKGSRLHETIVWAIDWYTQSVESRHLETEVIVAQAGLELLSWLCLVDEVGVEGFDRMSAADALRIALKFASVEPDVPGAAQKLFSATRKTSTARELDGPGAITEIRNGAIHPGSGDRLSDIDVKYQAARLAERYIELLLLHRFGYRGEMCNRIDWSAPPEIVPWAQVEAPPEDP